MLPVFFDHDGGVPDDYMALALLLTMSDVDLKGITVIPADSFAQPALRATRKILRLMGRDGVPVGLSHVTGVNAFPSAWRQMSADFEAYIPGALEPGSAAIVSDAVDLMADTLRRSDEPITLLVTGPLSTVAAVIRSDPGLAPKVKELVWMGGAVDVAGNVSPELEPGHDGSAEWNAYWDPPAVQFIWQTSIPIVLCSLDATNSVPVTADFVERLRAPKAHTLSRIAAHGYEMILDLPDVCLWDVLAAAYVGKPEFFRTQTVETAVVVTGPSQGRIKREAGGRLVRLIHAINAGDVLNYVLVQWVP